MSMEVRNVVSQFMDLKTSVPGVTRKEEIKTGFGNVKEYSKYLQGKYSYMNTGTTSMQGVPTTVTVSSAFLQKCMNDPEKAKYLEENLAAIPDCAKSAVNGCLGTITSQSWKIDANGNMSVTVSGTNDPDGRIARENAKRRAKEQKAAKEKSEKKAEEEKAAKRRAKKEEAEINGEPEFTISAVGTDAKVLTEQILDKAGTENTGAVSSFDAKA